MYLVRLVLGPRQDFTTKDPQMTFRLLRMQHRYFGKQALWRPLGAEQTGLAGLQVPWQTGWCSLLNQGKHWFLLQVPFSQAGLVFKTSAISQAIIYLTIITQIIPTKPFQAQAGNQGCCELCSTFTGLPSQVGRRSRTIYRVRKVQKKKSVSHKFSGNSEQHTGLTPPLGSRPHFQFGQFLSPAETIVSLRVIKKNPNPPVWFQEHLKY